MAEDDRTYQPAPIIQQEFLKWVNTPDEIFEYIEHFLKGEHLVISYDVDGKNPRPEWQKREGFELMNDLGVNTALSHLNLFVNKFTFHADYSEEEINRNTLLFAISFHVFMARNWKKFGIEPSIYYSNMIQNGIIGLIFSAYKMSGMRKFYKDVLQVKAGMDIPDEKKPKLLGIIPR